MTNNASFEDIQWNSKDPASSAQLYRCFAAQRNVRLEVDKLNLKSELPKLCRLLTLRCAATSDEVVRTLESSAAFTPSSASPFGDTQTKDKVRYKAEEASKGRLIVKISIPATFQQKFACPDSHERLQLESFTKQELAKAFRIPSQLLQDELTIVAVEPGSVVIYVMLSSAALLLVLIGLGLMQTAEWRVHQFKILLGLGGMVLGGTAGLFSGPLGSFVGGITGWAIGLGTAWLLEPPGKASQPRATTSITYPDHTASVTVVFNKEASDDTAIVQGDTSPRQD